MGWQTPKTNWKVEFDNTGEYIGDYFEASDYQRIKGNLEYLFDLSDSIGAHVTRVAIPNITTESFGMASAINALERSLDALVDASYDPGIPDRKTWYGNSAAPLASDLNRIESSCLMLNNSLTAWKNAIPRLAFVLGGVQFGK